MNLSTKHTGDALIIRTKDIKSMIKKDDKWLICIKIPKKRKNSDEIRIASYDVAKSILEEIKSKHLRRYLEET